MNRRLACLLREQWREFADAATQADYFDSIVRRQRARRSSSGYCGKCIDVMYDSHLMTALDQRARESPDGNRITAKAVRRVKRRGKTESQGGHAAAWSESSAER